MKKIVLSFFLIVITTLCFAQDSETVTQVSNTVKNNGIGLGAAIAVVASWDRNKSILWAILHGILGWFYVIYYAFTR